MTLYDKFIGLFTKSQAQKVREDFKEEPFHKLSFLYGLQELNKSLIFGDIPDSDTAYIEQGFHFNDIVFAVVDYLSNLCASVPYKFMQEVNGEVMEARESPALFKARKLLERPNKFSTWESFVKNEVAFNLICSKSIIYKCRRLTGDKDIYELYNVSPAATTIVWKDEFYRIIDSVYIATYGMGGELRPAPTDLIIRYNTDLTGQNLGKSRLSAGRRSILKSNNARNAANKLFENSGAYGFLSVEDEGVGFDETQKLEAAYQKKHTGPGAQGKIVFTNGKIRFERTGMTAVDMQLAQNDANDLRTICSLFGVPSQLFNDTAASTFANYKEARRALYSNCILPNLKEFFAKLSWELLPELDASLGNVYLAPDLAAIPELQTTIQEQATALKDCDWLTPNEKRAAMGYASIDDPAMDMVYMNGQPIETLGIDGIQPEG